MLKQCLMLMFFTLLFSLFHISIPLCSPCAPFNLSMHQYAPHSLNMVCCLSVRLYVLFPHIFLFILFSISIYIYTSLSLSIALSLSLFYFVISLSLSLYLSISFSLSLYLSLYLCFSLYIYIYLYMSLSVLLSLSLSLSFYLSVSQSLHLTCLHPGTVSPPHSPPKSLSSSFSTGETFRNSDRGSN